MEDDLGTGQDAFNMKETTLDVRCEDKRISQVLAKVAGYEF